MKKKKAEQDTAAKVKQQQTAEEQLKTHKEQSRKNRIILVCLAFFVQFVTQITGNQLMGATLYVFARNIVFSMALSLLVIFLYFSGITLKRFNYDDKDHPERFFITYIFGTLSTLIFIYLPATAWTILVFYVLLSIVSDEICGIAGGTAILITTVLTGQSQDLSALAVYFICGIIAVAMFRDIREGFRMVLPVCLSLGFQLLLLCAGEILILNKKMGIEDFLFPVANGIINCIIICLFVQYYCNHICYSLDTQYQTVTDPEFELMNQLREHSMDDYRHCLHTAYLVERIATDLHMDVASAKCAAYYFRLDRSSYDAALLPVSAEKLILQVQKGIPALRDKEAVVIHICSSTMKVVKKMQTQNAQKELDYNPIIDAMFEKLYSLPALMHTDISLREWQYIRKRLKEEKMYYDFLCRD